MAFKVHEIVNYTVALTLSNNDYAAKMQLTLANKETVAYLYFMYEGTKLPAAVVSLDSATLYLSIKDLSRVLDLARNEKPLNLVLNPPLAFLSTSFEPIGENEKQGNVLTPNKP